jgi:hypothetical protein
MQDTNKTSTKLLRSLPIFLVLPFVALFDTLIFFITKPSCLTCSTLPDFLQTASLSMFLLTSIGYKFVKKS